ncbi:hypothetical protein [Streptomyces sp. NPDC001068]|uniref:hypothetical protein n=1 Tax=Streptomyces sp. NPDC001068 TaxID=3364544 RepID=UPI00369B8A23
MEALPRETIVDALERRLREDTLAEPRIREFPRLGGAGLLPIPVPHGPDRIGEISEDRRGAR